MGRAKILINDAQARAKAIRWITRAPWNARITFQGPARTLPQNDRMWVLLTHISEQLLWHGRKHSTDDWKDFFCAMLKRETLMMTEDGLPVPVGRSTSNMSKEEHSDLTTIIVMFADRHGVDLKTDRPEAK